MSEWITDRKPTKKDAYKESVWLCRESLYVDDVRYGSVILGEPWMPITPPEPYVKPKRFRVEQTAWEPYECFAIYDDGNDLRCSFYLPTREAAERIAAIYEEVMP